MNSDFIFFRMGALNTTRYLYIFVFISALAFIAFYPALNNEIFPSLLCLPTNNTCTTAQTKTSHPFHQSYLRHEHHLTTSFYPAIVPMEHNTINPLEQASFICPGSGLSRHRVSFNSIN